MYFVQEVERRCRKGRQDETNDKCYVPRNDLSSCVYICMSELELFVSKLVRKSA